MSTRSYRVSHRTDYRYGAPVVDGYSVAWLFPRATSRQRVSEATIIVEPTPTEHLITSDLFGNRVDHFGIHTPHQELTFTASSMIDLDLIDVPVDDTPWEDVVADLAAARDWAGAERRFLTGSSPMVPVAQLSMHPLVTELTSNAFVAGRSIIDAIAALSTAIFEMFEFDAQFSNVSTPLTDVLDARRGVCQDFAHLSCLCVRSVGLAARYVSGYLETLPPPGQPRLVGADASHAWCSVWTPNADWVDFDPTNNLLPVNDHLCVAWGRDYGDVTPVRGVMIGPASEQQLDVSVDVERVTQTG